jgi:hypothetical protein
LRPVGFTAPLEGTLSRPGASPSMPPLA